MVLGTERFNIINTVKPVKSGRSKKTENGFQDKLSLNAGKKYCRMFQGEHFAIRLPFIKLPFVIKVIVATYVSCWSCFLAL